MDSSVASADNSRTIACAAQDKDIDRARCHEAPGRHSVSTIGARSAAWRLQGCLCRVLATASTSARDRTERRRIAGVRGRLGPRYSVCLADTPLARYSVRRSRPAARRSASSTRADTTRSDVVVMTAGAGRLGTLLVQAAAGAAVLATAGGPAKVNLVGSLGADLAVDHRPPHWPDEAGAALDRARRHGRTKDRVGGAVGGAASSRSQRVRGEPIALSAGSPLHAASLSPARWGAHVRSTRRASMRVPTKASSGWARARGA